MEYLIKILNGRSVYFFQIDYISLWNVMSNTGHFTCIRIIPCKKDFRLVLFHEILKRFLRPILTFKGRKVQKFSTSIIGSYACLQILDLYIIYFPPINMEMEIGKSNHNHNKSCARCKALFITNDINTWIAFSVGNAKNK